MAENDLAQGWEAQAKQQTLFRRFGFDTYAQTRTFLDELAALTESGGVHPQSINFGSNYVNVTLDPAESGQADVSLAQRINALYKPTGS
jgi:4a-hydroxytetrahydrobiopterin dehydratase